MTKFPLIAFLACFAGHCLAQEYIIVDSTYKQGKVTRIEKGQIMFKAANAEQPIAYSMNDVKEYREGGAIYEAVMIGGKRDFYRRLVTGRVNLYRRSGDYVLKDSSSFLEVERKNFRSVLSGKLKCSGKDQSLSKLSWTRPAIAAFVRSYNENRCDVDAIPHRKFGLVAGYNFIKTDISPNASWSSSITSKVPSIGAFIDFPFMIRRASMYFTLEGSYLAFQPAYDKSASATVSNFMALDIKGINAIGSFKLIARSGSVRPYMKLGFMMSHLTINSPTGAISTNTNGNVITIDGSLPSSFGNTDLFGFNFAGGIEVPLIKRTNLHFEIRYNKSVGNGGLTDLTFTMSNVGLTTGINF